MGFFQTSCLWMCVFYEQTRHTALSALFMHSHGTWSHSTGGGAKRWRRSIRSSFLTCWGLCTDRRHCTHHLTLSQGRRFQNEVCLIMVSEISQTYALIQLFVFVHSSYMTYCGKWRKREYLGWDEAIPLARRWLIAASTNTDKMHSSHPRPSGEPPEILVNTGPWRCPGFSSLPLQNWAGLAVFVCVSAPAPASRSSVVSTRPLSSHQTRGTQPCCHSAQAPQRLRFPLGLTEVFAVSHIVGIQHQPVYWSPCGFSLFPSLPPSLSPCFLFFFPLSTTHLLYIHTQHSYQVMRQNTTKQLTVAILFLPMLQSIFATRVSYITQCGQWRVRIYLSIYHKNIYACRYVTINQSFSLSETGLKRMLAYYK